MARSVIDTMANLIENMSDIIYSIDSEGVFALVSPAWTNLLGHAAAEVEGRSFAEFIHPDDAERYGAYLRKILNDGETRERIEYRMRHKAGEWRWYSSSARAARNGVGAIIGMDGIARDITERKKAETGLRESEAELRGIIENSPVGYYVYNYDEKGDLVFSMFNQAADAMIRANHEKFLGHRILEAFPALAGTGIPEMYASIAKGEMGTQDFEAAYDHDGISGVFEVRAFRGAPLQTVVNFTDITKRKQIEESMKQSQKLLTAKNKELEQLVYVASHDLRSPLVNVDGFSRELEFSIKEIGGLLEGGAERGGLDHGELEKALRKELPELSAAIGRIRSSTRQMDSLLKGLLTLSRSGREALRIEAVDMDELARQLSASFAYRIKNAGIELNVEKLPPCMGDRVMLTQVFANLIDNAIKYLDKDRPGKIDMRGTIEDNRARYRIEDNGIGIDGNHHEKIFELFYRLNPRQTEGDGLGLPAARQILGRMDGEIRVVSRPGEGSAFIVVLPPAKEIQ